MFFDTYRELCLSAGKTPSAVAVELGIGKASVSDWKNKGQTPRADKLQLIADYFGVSIDYLLGTEKAATSKGDGWSDNKRNLIEAVEQMTEEQAELLLSLWEQFKAER